MSIAKICSVENCEDISRAKGFCNKHYLRVRYGGSTDLRGYYKTHGKRFHPLYHRWNDIKQRCNNPNDSSYSRYGGRGISVCDRWLGENGFDNFLNDMGDLPSPKHSIDRVNNDGNYEPLNCRWATDSEQALNRRTPTSNTTGHKGVYFDKRYNKWYAAIKVRNIMHQSHCTESLQDAIEKRKELERLYL